jgi:hypothetical protein
LASVSAVNNAVGTVSRRVADLEQHPPVNLAPLDARLKVVEAKPAPKDFAPDIGS